MSEQLAGVSNEALMAAIAKNKVQAGRDIGISGSFVTGFASDEAETVRYMASQLYPQEPLEKAVQRFGKKDGLIVHMGDDGQIYEARPSGWSPRAIASDVARGAGKAIPAGAGFAAGALTLPLAATGVGLAGTMAAAGGAAAGGEVIRQKAGDYMMGPASTNNIDVPSVVTEGVTSGFGQGIGVGMNALASRGAVRDINRFDPVATRKAYDSAAKVGVDITPAEATGLPTLGAQQKRLSNITATADDMRTFYANRDKQVLGAWSKFMDNVSPAADAEDVGLLARGAARDVLKGMRQEMQAAAKPFYEAAEAKPVPFTRELEDLMKRPVMRDAIAKARELAANEGVESKQFFAQLADDGSISISRVPDMKGWDYIKRGLDEVIQSDKSRNQQTGGLNNFGRIVTDIKNKLLTQLDDAVPEYAQARAIYQEGAEDLATAMQSAMKTLADTKDVNILSAARHIFDPRARSPQMVTTLRGALEKQNPEAWQGLKRLYLQDVSTDALRIAESGDVMNPAGKIFKAFSNPRVAENMRAAMSPQEYGRMQDILAVFRRAASVPTLRSDTEFNRLASEEAVSMARPLISKIARNINPVQALRSFDDFMTNRAMDRNAERLVDLVTTSEPTVIEAMKELRRIPLATQEFKILFGHVVSQGGKLGASSYLANTSDRKPNYSPDQGAAENRR